MPPEIRTEEAGSLVVVFDDEVRARIRRQDDGFFVEVEIVGPSLAFWPTFRWFVAADVFMLQYVGFEVVARWDEPGVLSPEQPHAAAIRNLQLGHFERQTATVAHRALELWLRQELNTGSEAEMALLRAMNAPQPEIVAIEGESPRRGRPRSPSTRLQLAIVIQQYQTLLDAGVKHPAAELARLLDVPRGRVRNWLYEARQLGLLHDRPSRRPNPPNPTPPPKENP